MTRPLPRPSLVLVVAATLLALGCAPDRAIAPERAPAGSYLNATDDGPTIAAAAEKPSITINLQTSPNGFNVPFEAIGRKLHNFELDTDASTEMPSTITFGRLKPGDYLVRVGFTHIPALQLTAINCSTPDGNATFQINLPARTISITLAKGGSVNCTTFVATAT